MVTAVGGSVGPIDTRALDLSSLWDGTVTAASSTMMTVDEGGGYTAHFTGVGVTYDSFGDPLSGTITGISEDFLGQTTFSITDMNVSAVQFAAWVANDANLSATVNILSGNDLMKGTAFNDYIEGFAGHDSLVGGSGADTLLGGDGNDHLYGQSATGGVDSGDWLEGGDGMDYLQGNAGNDTLQGGTGSDRINGGADDDWIIGGLGNDSANGNLGDDTIEGNDGNDSLRGGQGNDLLDGGAGNDLISGDKGQDTMTGGSGSDLFHLGAGEAGISSGNTDLITDYVHGVDHLQLGFHVNAIVMGQFEAVEILAQLDAQNVLNQHSSEFGDVVAYQIGTDTYLFWNSLGGQLVDSAVKLHDVQASTLTLADFV